MTRGVRFFFTFTLGLGGCLAMQGWAGAQEKKDPDKKEIPEIESKGKKFPEAAPFSTDGFQGSGSGGRQGSIPWSSSAITSDSTLVGPYNQPAWTTTRPFLASRAYVIPEGQMEVEQWLRYRNKRHGQKPEYRFLEEFAVGLPGRFQLDIYERWRIEPDDHDRERTDHEGVQLEMRWAFADWGVIPLNPTVYLEWVQRGQRNDPNVYEFRLLLAEQLGEKLFWSANFKFEQQTGNERETEWAFSQSVAVPIIERKLTAGMEMLLRQTTVHGGRGDPEWEFLIGPGLQWRPTNRTFLNIVPLFGTSSNSPRVELFVNFGVMFGNRAGPSMPSGPVSTSAF